MPVVLLPLLLVLGLTVMALSGCSKGSEDTTVGGDPFPVDACGKDNSSESSLAQELDDDAENQSQNGASSDELVPQYCKTSNPTWYGNVLPLINSRIDGQKYQCSTCHDNYKQYSVTRDELDDFMESMRQSGTKFMPRVGNRVPDDCMDMLEDWQNDGHPKGDLDDQAAAVAVEQERDRERQLAFANGEKLKNTGENCSSQARDQ